MPGIVGIFSSRPSLECERELAAMMGCLWHEPFYTGGTFTAPDQGVYAGWTALEDSFAAQQVFCSAKRDVVLLWAGECFQEERATKDAARSGSHWLVAEYERYGHAFVKKLNGLFSGILIDRRTNRTFLFNDRYAAERVYWTETHDGLYFASEAKAILRVRPECRAFDESGVAQFLNFGCTVEDRTLFRGVSMLRGGSCWTLVNRQCRKQVYFSPATWEAQPALTNEEFQLQYQATFKRILPRYFRSPFPLGMSLTAGLDTRMIMACRPQSADDLICFTYSGTTVDPLDARIAKRIAACAGLEHHVLRIGPDFFRDFATLADRTVYLTDGSFGVMGAHETYMSRHARRLSPVRLTGNFGGEVLRGVSTFRPRPPAEGLVAGELRACLATSAQQLADWKGHQITYAAFREVPWNLFGNLQAGRSQVGFRTPYLDNELVALAYRAPASLRRSRATALRVVRDNSPTLAAIPTDKAYLGDAGWLVTWLRQAYSKLTFKLDYMYSEGLPNSLSPVDLLYHRVATRLGIMGLHKHLHYRSWFRRELAGFICEALAEARMRQSPFWNASFLRIMEHDHIRGRRNYVLELNAVLTIAAVERLLFHWCDDVRASRGTAGPNAPSTGRSADST